jgi:hypothetical protein
MRKPSGQERAPSGPGWDDAAANSLAGGIAAGVEVYDRRRHLPRLLPVGPAELTDDSTAARRRIVARLACALRAERNRGRAGHWTYDLNRHIGLSQAYAAERRRLDPSAAVGGPPALAAAVEKPRPPPMKRRRFETSRGTVIRRGDGAVGRDPSSWRAPSAPRRSWERPSDSRRPGPISRGIRPEKGRNGS